jgi:hypothetical protein
MKSETHFIEKQKLYFDFGSEERARSWNKHANTFYHQEILPVLSEVFDANVPADNWYSIDHLEIDLGDIRAWQVKGVLKQAVEKRLREILGRGIQPSATTVLERTRLSSGKGPAPPAKSPDDVTVKNGNERLLEIFLKFLDYGVLQWHTAFESIEELEKDLVNQIGIEDLVRRQDFTERMNLPFVRKRLFYQFSKSFTVSVFYSFFSKELEIITAFQRLLKLRLASMYKQTPSIRSIREAISEDVLKWVATAEVDRKENLPKVVIRGLIDRILLIGTGSDIVPSSFILKLLSPDDQLCASFPQMAQIINSIPRSAEGEEGLRNTPTRGEEEKQGDPSGNNVPSGLVPSAEPAEALTNKSVPDMFTNDQALNDETSCLTDKKLLMSIADARELEATREESEDTTKDTGSDLSALGSVPDKQDVIAFERGTFMQESAHKGELTEYYVRNAGIVLCWPYLNQLFTRSGYLYLTNFKDIEAQERAIHVLGYIASCAEKCPEQELMMPKFLAGWPLQMPVIKDLKLLKKEKKEADGMLASLILNWSILKNTSINGLRSSFFSRDGKLVKQEDCWKLVVEQKSYDMLLDYLPYSISIVKLPWNKNVLKVDWA